MNEERLYAIYTGTAEAPQYRYVGKTVLSVGERWTQHLRAADNPRHTKELYEVMRHEGISTFSVIELDNSGGETEQDYVTRFIKDGHRLVNSNRGNSVVAKRPTLTFSKANREADETIERKQRLHGKTQALRKSEIVIQRITGHAPNVPELMGAHWLPTDPGVLGQDVQRTGKRAEILRWGDYKFLVAYRPNGRHEDAEVSAVIENTRNGTELRASGWWMKRIPGAEAKKERILNYLLTIWLDPTIDPWVKPYRGV